MQTILHLELLLKKVDISEPLEYEIETDNSGEGRLKLQNLIQFCSFLDSSSARIGRAEQILSKNILGGSAEETFW